MPPDILEQISDRLSLVDYVRFRGVCKQWRSSPSDRSELVAFSRAEPWLILCEPGKGVDVGRGAAPRCYIYARSHPRCCAIRLRGLEGAVVVKSKLGWLLARRGDRLFFYNPLTFSRVNLPKLGLLNVSGGGGGACTFAYLPTLRECTAVVVSRADERSPLELSTCRVGGGGGWATQAIPGISSDEIGRAVRVSTCGHRGPGACSGVCPSPRNSTVFIHDPEKRNAMWYHFVAKAKTFVFDHSNEELTAEYYEQRAERRRSPELEEMLSRRGVWVSFADEDDSGTVVVGPPHVDERAELDGGVEASLVEPPKPAGRGLSWPQVFFWF